VIYEDDASAVVKMLNLIINLLRVSNAPTLIEPVPVAAPGGSRALLTIEVDDAEAVCAELAAHGVKLLNGPVDRPWGRRTAAFTDPAGNTWEIAQVLS
jgi:catechol 2,3-dioxygenase-like lactoylglutathione lyase family enzyme